MFVGIRPSVAANRRGSALDRLAAWYDAVGIDYAGFVNAITEPGRDLRGVVDKENLLTAVAGADRVVALGGFVSGVLDGLCVEHHTMYHPSPRNRALNDRANEDRALDGLRKYLDGSR